jgi:hypothetical protein
MLSYADLGFVSRRCHVKGHMLYLTALDIGLIFRRLIEKRETGNESYEASMWLIPVSTGL